MNPLDSYQLIRHLKTVPIKVKDIKKGDIITQFNARTHVQDMQQTSFYVPWLVTKIKKRKFSITLYDHVNCSIELRLNVARPNFFLICSSPSEETNTVVIIPRTFLKSYKDDK